MVGMGKALEYGMAKRGLSSSAIISLALGGATLLYLVFLAVWKVPPGASNAFRWKVVGPLYLLGLVGFVVGIAAIIGRRRYWPLGILGLLLSGLPYVLTAIVYYLFRR
jgi:hypothetical protein